MIIQKNILLIILLVLVLLPNIAYLADPVTKNGVDASTNCTSEGGKVCLNVPIGGVKQASFEEYLALWYNFVLGVSGILATVIIMWGGFKWLTSRGNSAAISDAKDRIWSAVIGLVLLFLSYTLLSIINPRLVNISLPILPGVQTSGTSSQLPNLADASIYNLNPSSGTRGYEEQVLDSTIWEEVFGLDPNNIEGYSDFHFTVPPTPYLPGGNFDERVYFQRNLTGGFVVHWDDMTKQEIDVFSNVLVNDLGENFGFNWRMSNITSNNTTNGLLIVPQAK